MRNVDSFHAANISGFLHQPDGRARGGAALTHGAGGDCQAKILVAVAEALTAAGWFVLRYDLPFRRQRRFGPPMPKAAAADQAGIRDAIAEVRRLAAGPVIAGGHSYGGRQTTMLAAQEPGLCDAVLALSYPLHPPNKPEQLRTAHFPSLRTPVLFVSGAKDEFGTIDELNDALRNIPAPHNLMTIDRAGHDLKSGKFDIESMVVRPLESLLFPTSA